MVFIFILRILAIASFDTLDPQGEARDRFSNEGKRLKLVRTMLTTKLKIKNLVGARACLAIALECTSIVCAIGTIRLVNGRLETEIY